MHPLTHCVLPPPHLVTPARDPWPARRPLCPPPEHLAPVRQQSGPPRDPPGSPHRGHEEFPLSLGLLPPCGDRAPPHLAGAPPPLGPVQRFQRSCCPRMTF